jgi:hypothetical protein
MVFDATFNNISAISWWSVLLVDEDPGKTTDMPQVTDKLYHISNTTRLNRIRNQHVTGIRH